MTAWVVLALLSAPGFDVQHRELVVSDGARLVLTKLTPPAPRGAVVLFADVGFGRGLYRALGPYLAARGRTVYLADLRGQGAASARGGLVTSARLDVPAVLRAATAEVQGPVDVVAHGWLGALVLARVAGPDAPAVRRVIAANTPVSAELPNRAVERFLAGQGRFTALASSPGGSALFAALFAPEQHGGPRALASVAWAARDLGPERSAELLAWMRAGDLPLEHGTLSQALAAYDRPTLQLLALGDGFAPPELASPLREVSRAPVQLRTFTRLFSAEDYGHASLFLSPSAPRDVFPPIAAFLEAP